MPSSIKPAIKGCSHAADSDNHRSQESALGAWLDVVVDNISRGAVWCWAVEGPLAIIPIATEFLTFASTQKVAHPPLVLPQHTF